MVIYYFHSFSEHLNELKKMYRKLLLNSNFVFQIKAAVSYTNSSNHNWWKHRKMISWTTPFSICELKYREDSRLYISMLHFRPYYLYIHPRVIFMSLPSFLTSTSLKNWKLLLFIPCEISAVWTWDLLKRSGFVSRIEEQNMFPKNEGKNMQSANKTVSSPLSSFNRGAKPIDCWEVWQNYLHLSIFSSEN